MIRKVTLVAALALATAISLATQPRFFPDDPIWTDNDRVLDASKAAEQEDFNGYDFIVNTFLNPRGVAMSGP